MKDNSDHYNILLTRDLRQKKVHSISACLSVHANFFSLATKIKPNRTQIIFFSSLVGTDLQPWNNDYPNKSSLKKCILLTVSTHVSEFSSSFKDICGVC